ncbi:MAG: GNAT family N-acetyltransferase [Ginsengibacter sp.]
MNFLLTDQQSDRLLFREIRTSDFDVWLKFFETPETSKSWIYKKEDPKIECTKWYERQFERYQNDQGGMNALIEKSSGELIGHCGLLQQTVDKIHEVEIAYSLLPQFWNKGYATEAAIHCRDYAFKNNLSPSLISIISITNIPSQNVAIKVGMALDKTTVYRENNVDIFRIWK